MENYIDVDCGVITLSGTEAGAVHVSVSDVSCDESGVIQFV